MVGLALGMVMIASICMWAIAKMIGETNEKIDQIRDELRKNRGEK